MTETPASHPYKLILSSKSPRRQSLLKELGWDFSICLIDVEEIYPLHLKKEEVPLFLSQLKADAYTKPLVENELLITADTVVCLDDLILGKPTDYEDACRILRLLSGRKHEVFTGICLKSAAKKKCFYVQTEVFFKKLSEAEIQYYLEKYQPYDKAGSYGIQEWIGLIGVEKIHGSYFNVMGLPIKEVYEEIMSF
jgi:septum formation protein